MSETARSMTRSAPARQEHAREVPAREESLQKHMNLAASDVETFPLEDRELELSGERAVAMQRVIWENRRFVSRATCAGLLLSVLIAFLVPQRFKSTARLMPPDQGNSGMAMLAASSNIGAQLGSGLGSLAGNLLGLKSSSDLFIGILQSRTVRDDLIEKFNLRDVYADKRMEDTRDDLSKRTSLAVDLKSGILTIEVVDHDPQRAAAMAGEYAGELDRVVTQLNTSSAHRERVFLESRLTQVKEDLESAEKNFSEFATKNTALDIPTQGKAMIEAAATLEGQLIAARTELQGLKQVYADGNVRVRATQARVDELQQQLDKNLSGTANGPAVAGGANRPSLYPSIRELPALGIGYADLFRNTKVQETVFQTLTQEYEMAKVEEAKETPSVKILDYPDVPEKRSFPPRLWIVALGTMIALGASVTWIFSKRAWDQTDDLDPQKVFAREVLYTLQAHLPWGEKNGTRAGAINDVWSHLPRSKERPRTED